MKIDRRRLLVLAGLALVALAAYAYLQLRPQTLVLTGIVTTDSVVVSSRVEGQIAAVRVKEGDTVKTNQLLAVIVPDELQAETAYYTQNAESWSDQVREAEAALRFEQRQTADLIQQAESTLASV